MKYIFFLVLVTSLIAVPSCKYFKANKNSKTLAIVKAQGDSIRVADSLKKDQERMENERIEAERKAAQEKQADESKQKYNIIVGSFVTPEYANNLSDAFRKKGYSPKILQMEGSKFQLVAAETFENFRDAVRKLKLYQDTVQSEAWVYTRK